MHGQDCYPENGNELTPQGCPSVQGVLAGPAGYFTTVTAPCNGTIADLSVAVGNTVEAKDLMVTLVK